jgi:hypothetical protein
VATAAKPMPEFFILHRNTAITESADETIVYVVFVVRDMNNQAKKRKTFQD